MRTYLLVLVRKLIGFFPESRCFRLKVLLHNLCGQKLHTTARIYSSVIFATLPVRVGARSHVGAHTLFVGDIGCPIDIGDDCDIGPRVTFLTGTHEVGPASRRAGKGLGLPVTVRSGCWIGASAVILPGVTIGPGSIVAAGSVVSSDVPPNSLVAGVPATVKKMLSD